MGRENNQVKRNTESGFIPMEGITKPQSSGGAFRFPRTSSRGGRKLELPEETEELDEPVLSGFRFSKEKGGRRLDIDVEELRIRLGEWDVNNDSEFYPNVELDVLY